uniref:cGMP-dependent protein kinase n=1 Tax=Cynoglossus semilaevis TaxID=244447 RepID=A0A3P8UHV6_CYNSE
MGNGSIKATGVEENNCLASVNKVPALDTKALRLRIANLEAALAQRDQEFRAQTHRLQQLQKELEAKVLQIDKLEDAIGYNNTILGRSPPMRCHRSNDFFSVINQGSGRFHQVAVEVHRRLKAKEGVSAEPTSENFFKPRCCFALSTKKLINDAIANNDFLKRLEPQHMREMMESMYEKVYTKGQLVIQEGEPGNYLYVLAEGLLQVVQSGKMLGEMRPGTAFGELAILYNCKRTATVKAVSQSHIWALDRHTFQTIMMQTTQARHEEYFCFLRSVPLLRDLPEEKLAKIVDCLEVDCFEKGEYIIREGEEGNTFFIIAKGEVIVTQSTEGFIEPQEIKTLTVGDYFGEKALISEDVRSANIVSNQNDTHCLVVDRDNFNQIVGTYEELQAYLKEYVKELSRSDQRRNALAYSPQLDSVEAQEMRRLREKIALLPQHQPFQQLEIVATLGSGGFGRVELVKLKDEDTTFALKCIKKKHIVDTNQQEHIYSEKNILQEIKSEFIIRLFRTFRDSRFVYMLLEVCLGGELWTVLRDMGYFDEPTARFCTGCVLEAFDYLHTMGIIFRDLKPENLLLDTEGYVKMADFGFAKKIGLGKKTWTFCGTPEYLAPEVIMNKGHDFGADCWSLGILIFELLTGSPPFSGSDHIRIYTMILHGIEKIDFPRRISKRPDDLIRRLCRFFPVAQILNHCVVLRTRFNWEGLRHHKLSSPLKTEVKGPLDYSHFDLFPPDTEEVPEELSGWDKDF